jgi:hypothetical protein
MHKELPFVLRFCIDIFVLYAAGIWVSRFVANGKYFSETLFGLAIGARATDIDLATNGDSLAGCCVLKYTG